MRKKRTREKTNNEIDVNEENILNLGNLSIRVDEEEHESEANLSNEDGTTQLEIKSTSSGTTNSLSIHPTKNYTIN